MGGINLVGGVDSRGSYVLEILCVKMKESGPLGACAGHAPSRSANAITMPTTNSIILPNWWKISQMCHVAKLNYQKNPNKFRDS